MTEPVFHIAFANDWVTARGQYAPSCLRTDGFVHCSTAEQVLPVANSKYAGRSDLVLLVVDPQRLQAELRYEGLEGRAELFPHIYGPIERAAVIATEELRIGGNGKFETPRVIEERFSGPLQGNR